MDRDITEELRANEWYVSFVTPHSIVIPAGVGLKSVEKFTGYHLVAGKNITVNSSINAAVYAGMVDLQALGGNVVIGPGVILTGRDYVSVSAGRDLTVGARASFQSRGGSANLGTVSVRAATGDITFGSGVAFGTLRDIFIVAVAGDVSAESGLRAAAPQGMLYVEGGRVIINGAQLRAGEIQVLGDRLPLEFKKNRVTVGSSGFFHIGNPGSSVDVTATPIPKSGSIDAATIID